MSALVPATSDTSSPLAGEPGPARHVAFRIPCRLEASCDALPARPIWAPAPAARALDHATGVGRNAVCVGDRSQP
jgi:hypothetical protein